MSKPNSLPKPSGWRILVRVKDIEEKTPGGVIIPEIAQHNERNLSSMGTVVELGPDAYTREDMSVTWCQPGDTVIFGKYGGHRIVVGDAEYRIMNDDEILATVPSEIKDQVRRAY